MDRIILNRILFNGIALSMGISAIFIWPNRGYCQNFRQMQPIVLNSDIISSHINIISSPETKEILRWRLSKKYEDDIKKHSQNNGLYNLDIKNDVKIKLDSQEQQSKMQAGGWTGGGGTGVACFSHPGSRHSIDDFKDSTGHLKSSSYDKITSLTMLDYFTFGQAKPALGFGHIPVEGDETAIEYLRRILNTHYSALAPLFTTKLLKYSEIVNQELEKQLNQDKEEPYPFPQPSLRDFGKSPMQAQERKLQQENCLTVQLATRYARIDNYSVQELFLDFDIKLLRKMRSLAPTNEVATVQEAALILHEAFYLIVSVLRQKDSFGTTFMAVPLLLSEATVRLRASSPYLRALDFRNALEYAGIGFFFLLVAAESEQTSNEIVNQHLKSLQEIAKLYISDLKKKSIDSLEDLQSLENRNYLIIFSTQLQNFSPVTSFIAVSIWLPSADHYFWDELFIESNDQKKIIESYCKIIHGYRNSALNSSFNNTIENALQYCTNVSKKN